MVAQNILFVNPPQPEPEKKTATGPTYGQLCQKHDDYAGPLWDKLDLLYEGGWRILKHAADFIDQAPRENSQYYAWRCKSTSYVNYFAKLVGYLTGALFNETLVVGTAKNPATEQGTALPDEKFYSEFWRDADLKGTDFSQFMRVTLASAMVYQRAIVQVDMPPAPRLPDGELPTNRAQEEALGGGRAYLIPVDIGDMFDWEKDEFGNFTWCVLHRIVKDRSGPFADRSKYQHEFKVWTIEGGVATWMVLRTKRIANEDELKDDDVLEVYQEPTPTSFKQIPLRELELPKALWVGNQAGPLCQEHYQRRSDLKGSLCRNLVEMPFVKLGPSIPGVHAALPNSDDPNRGSRPQEKVASDGVIVLNNDDEIGYAGPSGVAHEIARAELKDCREEIFGSLNAMALQLENSAAAVGRSGDSKKEDRTALGSILDFLADQLREYAQHLMALVSAARNEKVEWAASGLSTFDAEDTAEVLEEANSVANLQIPSRTFWVLHRTKVAHTLVRKATTEQKRRITDEIEANTTSEETEASPLEKMEQVTKAQNPEGDEEEDDEETPPEAE